MPHPARFALLSALALGLLLPALTAADFTALDELAQSELRRLNVPGTAIAVVHEGKVVHARGYGVRSVETQEPVTDDMLFRVGSTTKMFTAAGLVMLAEEGRLKLDEPIGNLVKDLHPAIARLTSHQLLSHTAGLSDPSVMTGPRDESALKSRILEMDERAFFEEPGRVYSYSNPGYWIAGLVQEEVSGHAYTEHLRRRIFEPLGMERSAFSPLVAMTWPFAIGHDGEGRAPPRIVRPLAENAAAYPAGQLFTTAPEFARFCIAFMQGGVWQDRQVIPAAVIEKMSAPHAAMPTEDRHYGYGLSVREREGLRWLSHSGSRTGYGSFVAMCPQRQFAVIILCNKTGANLMRVADKAAELVLGVAINEPAKKENLAMSAEEMARYAGTYASGSARAVLSVRDGKLMGAQGSEIRKTGDNRFLRAAAGRLPEMEFSFIRDAQGNITHLVSRGRAMKRVE